MEELHHLSTARKNVAYILGGSHGLINVFRAAAQKRITRVSGYHPKYQGTMENDVGFLAAVEEAQIGASEGGVPIGACLVSKDGKVLGRGHNMRVQNGSATIHAEISALENTGRLPASAYLGATMYTTLSPCDMCTGACLLYKIGRVVIGENRTFVGGEAYLKQRGVDVHVLQNRDCELLMERFIKEKPAVWNEDIGQ